MEKIFASSSDQMYIKFVWRYLATLFSTPSDIPKLVKTFCLEENFRKIFDRFVVLIEIFGHIYIDINIREIFGNIGGDVFGSDAPRLMDGYL